MGDKLDYDKLNKLNLTNEETMHILKLYNLSKKLSTNANQIEEDYFKKYNCKNEKEKIVLECNYVKNKLINQSEHYNNNKEYNNYLRIIDIILSNAKDIDVSNEEQIKHLKQYLVLIELDLDINISLFSEVNNILDMKLKRENEKRKV